MGFEQVILDEDWRHLLLHLWNNDGIITRLTNLGSVFSFEWAPDGSRLAAAMAPRSLVDDRYMFQRLHLVDPATGQVKKLVENPGKLGDFAWSPDSRKLAYISAVDRNDTHAGMLFVVDIESKKVSGLTPDFEGMVHSVYWLKADRVRLIVSRGVESRVTELDLRTKSWHDFPGGEMAFKSIATSGNNMAAVVSTPAHPEEVFALSEENWQRLTISNPWLEKVKLAKQQIFTFEARDGLKIEGILMFPRDFQEGKRYPLVIVVHGGPESHFNNGWLTAYNRWGQLLSQKGFFAWYPNYRSSTGRGVAFVKSDHGDPMGREFEDHIDAIAEFSKKGWVDSKRVGIGGGSYGGYTAAWAATRHSQRFAAAVSFVPVTHLPTKWYTSDIPWEFYYVHYQEKWPHEQMQFLTERSPLTYAAECRTPLLLAGGTNDTRVHPSQPLMLYRAVKTSTKTPVRYVRYPDEEHGNKTNVYRYDYCIRALRWFDHYLKPGENRQDVPPSLDLDYSEWEQAMQKSKIADLP
jgi:dipeptidyl aminopeptidase/acylaminoacyl peptidase